MKKLSDGSPNEVVQKALRVSYDGLDNEVKKIFLDIACFLKGESEEFVKELLESYGFYSTYGMETLKDKALITVAVSGEVEMHDLIQEMGHQIVREQNIDEPGKRTRLWDPNEICDVFKKCEVRNQKTLCTLVLKLNFSIMSRNIIMFYIFSLLLYFILFTGGKC